MSAVAETVRSLNGAWLLFKARPEGLLALDRSLSGFWRSFAVIVLIVPLNALTIFAIARTNPDETFSDLFGNGLPILALDWVAFPLALALFAGPLGVSATYASYVVARNWAAPIASTLLMVPFLLQGAGWIGPNATMVISLAALGLVLRYHFLILRIALRTSVTVSIALTIVDVLLTLLIAGLFD